jgi:hypothetical protein
VLATWYVFWRCRIKSPTTCLCSTSSSVIFTPANWSSIASINSTRSRKSAPRSSVKCVSLVTDSMSTRSCLATRIRTSSMERHWVEDVALLKRCQATDCHDDAPNSVRARNILQINVPGTVTLFQKSWSVAWDHNDFALRPYESTLNARVPHDRTTDFLLSRHGRHERPTHESFQLTAPSRSAQSYHCRASTCQLSFIVRCR